MEIISGLFDRMVLQRDARGRSDAKIEGQTSARGDVFARVNGKGWTRAGRAARGRFAIALRGLRAGGPYRVELQVRQGKRVLDSLVVKDVLVGDVWLVGGQSNMEGFGLRSFAANPDLRVRAFYNDDRWDVARDPIHNLWQAVDEVHGLLGADRDGSHGTGPAVAFGQEMLAQSGVPQGLIACAHGGTSMAQWDPALRELGGKSLYGAMLRRFRKNGAKACGLIWYQGESDASDDAAPQYTHRMKQFVRALRRDTRCAQLAVAMVQISRHVQDIASQFAGWNSIQDQQRKLPALINRLATVPAVDLSLDDGIHVGGPDVNRLGRRLAHAMRQLTSSQKKNLKPPIALRRCRLQADPITSLANIVVEFDSVQARLTAGGGRPSGFRVVGADAQPLACIFDTRLNGSRVIVRTNLPVADLSSNSLHYGHGTDPLCNIVDEADRSLPAFGPIPLGKAKALTGYVRHLRVSEPMPSAGKLHTLAYPQDLESLPWRIFRFEANFCEIHNELLRRAPEDLLVYFQFRFRVEEPMKLALLVGYDGPVKVWLDGRQVLHDPAGTNPALPDAGQVIFDAEARDYEVLFALGTNQCRAWGIYSRLQRLDVPSSAVLKGNGHYRMPKLLAP